MTGRQRSQRVLTPVNAAHIDERSDVFALGVMAAEAVTGRRPFRGSTHSELLLAIMNDPFTIGAAGLEWRPLEAVLRRAVAKDPSARYQSVVELGGDLLPALQGLPSITALSAIDPGPTGA